MEAPRERVKREIMPYIKSLGTKPSHPRPNFFIAFFFLPEIEILALGIY